MKRLILLTTIFTVLITFNFSCVSMKGIELKKEKTTLKEARRLYNDGNQKSSFKFYKELTNSNGVNFTVYMVTEEGMNKNGNQTFAGEMINTAVRYLVFRNDEIYVDTVLLPTEKNLKKAIEKNQ